MVEIRKATTKDFEILIKLGKTTFIEAHHQSATKEELDNYLNSSYHPDNLAEQLKDANNLFHLIYFNNIPAGFSKIIIGEENSNPLLTHITKLERIYILKEFYDKKLGLALMQFNIEISKKLNQKGMWLYVWTENHRAVNFYKKLGFKIIGEYDFQLTETKSNPNHQMLFDY